MSRVLHDWNNNECVNILENANASLNNDGHLILIEMLMDEQTANGGLLDMNMQVITGGKERTIEQYHQLANLANFKFESTVTYNNYSALQYKSV